MGHTHDIGQVVEETNTSGIMQRDYIFFDGRRIAWRDSSGNVYYDFADAIGSTRAVTNATGSVCFSADYYPYGQENDYNTSCSPTYKFTGYEYDSETGNYYAFARYYTPRLGRFMSPDPLAGGVGDPQSLNRYTYVRNNPATLTDPLGRSFLSCTGEPNGQVNQGTAETVHCTFSDNFSDFSASYGGGPPPNFNGLDVANSFINGMEGGPIWHSAGPAGGLSQQSNPGYQFGMEITKAEKGYVNRVYEIVCILGSCPLPDLIKYHPGPLGKLRGNWGSIFDLNTPALNLPSSLKPTCSVPGIMGQWEQALNDWLKNHPNTPPPPWLLTQPGWVVSCEAS